MRGPTAVERGAEILARGRCTGYGPGPLAVGICQRIATKENAVSVSRSPSRTPLRRLRTVQWFSGFTLTSLVGVITLASFPGSLSGGRGHVYGSYQTRRLEDIGSQCDRNGRQ